MPAGAGFAAPATAGATLGAAPPAGVARRPVGDENPSPTAAAAARRTTFAPDRPSEPMNSDWFGGDAVAGTAAVAAAAAPAPFASAELSPADKAAALAGLDEAEVRGCVRCPLHRGRRHTVFGEGDPDADLMFVGEGPGGTEDATGRPFVGRAGQKLDEMIGAMGLRRDGVYIANVVKCRAFLPGPPPKDRPPQPAEAATCMPYLHRQIEVVRPRVIVTLGLSATQYLLGTKQSMSRMRGTWHAWRGIPVMPTFHPSYVLRNYTPETRRAVWEDLKQVMAALGPPPPRPRP